MAKLRSWEDDFCEAEGAPEDDDDSLVVVREVISGSKLIAQKSEKIAYFEPISEPQFDETIGIFFKKYGLFFIRRLQFL